MSASNTTRSITRGDRMSREEFERRFDATPNLKKADLIDGVVYIPKPPSFRLHSAPHASLVAWLGVYSGGSPYLQVGMSGSIRLGQNDMLQPDAFMTIPQCAGGRTAVSNDDYLEGAPELVVEVTDPSTSYDLHEKKQVYFRNGVNEYIVFRTFEGVLDYFVLRDGQYRHHAAPAEGKFQSLIFPGLWLDTQALIAGDIAGVLAYLQKGIASPEHAAFVMRLKAAAEGAR